MPTPAEILERNAQQAKQAQAGGGKAHEGGGLLADADFEVSDDLPPESEMMKDASAFWMEKFSLKLCGKNLSAENTRKLLIAGAALLVVMLLVTIIAVSSSDDGAVPPLRPSAAALQSRGVTLPVEFIVDADSIDAEEEPETWIRGFEQNVVAALNDPQQGLPSLGQAAGQEAFRTDLQLDVSTVQVGYIQDTEPAGDPPMDAKKVVVYFLLSRIRDGDAILRTLDKQRGASSPLMTGEQSSGILDINIDLKEVLLEEEDVFSLEAGNGPCVRSGAANCGANADCVNKQGGHECICHAGYVHGEGTSCVAQSGGGTAGAIQEARETGDYLTPSVEQRDVTCAGDDCSGFTTWRLSVTLGAGAQNIYALFGDDDRPLDLPPAYQTASPFGVNIGGVYPAFLPSYPQADFDSWLTVGPTQGDPGLISTIGIDWDCWQKNDQTRSGNAACVDSGGGIHITDGAVFWMNPDDGPTGAVSPQTGCAVLPNGPRSCPIVIAQITSEQARWRVSMGAQGRHSATDNWQDTVVRLLTATQL